MSSSISALVERYVAASQPAAKESIANDLFMALYSSGEVEELEPLHLSDDPFDKRVLVELLAEHAQHAPRVAGWVLDLLQHPDPAVRWHAVEPAVNVPAHLAPEVVAQVFRLLRDEDDVVRYSAALGLRILNPTGIEDVVVPILDDELGTAATHLVTEDLSHWTSRLDDGGVEALVTLVIAARAGVREPLERGREHPDEAVREASVRLLDVLDRAAPG